MPERVQAMLDRVLEWWKKFNNKQRILLISIVAVVLIALAVLGYAISQPTYVTLIQCTDAAQAAQVKEILTGDGNIKYRVNNDLTFEVDQKDEVSAEMLLGKNSIPAASYSINNVVDGSFSKTEADKQKLYREYLSEKFADHLSQLDFVESAKVDIDLPNNDGTILSSKEEGKAAVILDLNRDISEEQAYAIARYVATQMGNKTTDSITVIDKKANVLYSGTDSSSALFAASSQLSYKEKNENIIKAQIKNALENSNIFSNIEIMMNLDMNFDQTKIASKEYSYPDGLDKSLLDSSSIYRATTTGGGGGVPGTDSNNSDNTTYVTPDSTNSSSEIEDNDYDWLNNEKITETTKTGGDINYDNSSVSIVATRYIVYNQETLEANGTLGDDMTWEQFKVEHGDPVKVDVDDEFISMIHNATGFSTDSITFMIYEQPEFVDKDTTRRSLSDIFQILLAVLIFALLGFVVFRSTRTAKEAEPEPELSVDDLLESTTEPVEELENIGYTEKSETRIMIEKFVDENPEAVALLLRNWLNEDWE